MWDAYSQEFQERRHLRFTGICVKAARKLHDNGYVVDMTFHDYSALFLANKPMKTSGMPEYSDTLREIWERICDNTGAEDPVNGKILSSVDDLKPRIRFVPPELEMRTLGETVPLRFRKIAKPQPKTGASSWDVWQWCIGALGLISYISGDECVVTDTTEHYKKVDAAKAIYGQNMYSLEEEVDAEITSKGILLKSMDPITGRVMEAFYPPPGDERLKTKRSAVGKSSEGGAAVTANEVSGDYEEYNRYDITDQKSLDRCAQEAYAERSRQEIQGSFKTAEMVLPSNSGGPDMDILDLMAGDAIRIEMDQETKDALAIIGSEAGQIRYLRNTMGYSEEVAQVIVDNLKSGSNLDSTFHVKSIEVALGPEHFEVEVKYHNLILVSV
jgi:translation elongation factor P/translation initiation factor 5A